MHQDPNSPQSLVKAWQAKVQIADQNNILSHCQSCGYEWVDSGEKSICSHCGSKDIERIRCWQFPDG
ncbi:MAG: hypothetical protein ACFBSC_05905 [Microcoleaceae cyanobacterium]